MSEFDMKDSFLKRGCEEVDACVFSGDSLHDQADLAAFRQYVERWMREIEGREKDKCQDCLLCKHATITTDFGQIDCDLRGRVPQTNNCDQFEEVPTAEPMSQAAIGEALLGDDFVIEADAPTEEIDGFEAANRREIRRMCVESDPANFLDECNYGRVDNDM